LVKQVKVEVVAARASVPRARKRITNLTETIST
jgi:hypothetical protein